LIINEHQYRSTSRSDVTVMMQRVYVFVDKKSMLDRYQRCISNVLEVRWKLSRSIVQNKRKLCGW